MKQIYIGIDVGKKFSAVCVLDHNGKELRTDRVETLAHDAWLKLLQRFKGATLRVAFEVGPHYDWMFDLFAPFCLEVLVVAPGDKPLKKTDRTDAARLARLLWRGDLQSIYVPPSQIRRDRRLVARLHALSGQIGTTKIMMRDMLYTAQLTCPHSDLAGAKAREWLASALLKLEAQEQLLLEQLLAQLALLQDQYQQLYALISERLKEYPEAKLLRSIPGFGPLVTLAVLSALGQIGRFATPDQLASYFGLCGRVDQSGDRLQIFSITRRGNRHARWLLGQAVTHLICRDPKARRRYQKLRRKKKAKVARVALMRWITTIVWRMLKSNEQYRLNGQKGNYRGKRAA